MKVVIAGGGIAGIIGSIILAEKGDSVTLVESGESCGGLLRSYQAPNGTEYDYGTHILKETGHQMVDDLVFGKLEPEKWQNLDRLRVGNYFGGDIYPTSQFIDIRKLPSGSFDKALVEYISLGEEISTGNLEEYAKSFYGPTLTEELWKPLMAKLFGQDLADLDVSALSLVGYGRVIALDRHQTIEIKKSEMYDRKFGHATWDEGLSSQMNFYPVAEGIELWIKQLLRQAEEAGVTILTGTSIDKIEHCNTKVNQVNLSSGDAIEVDRLIWTLPTSLLFRNAGVEFQADPPLFRSSILLNFEFDAPFLTDLYFLYCNDPDMLSFRITLYPNLRELPEGEEPPYNCTVEVMADEEVFLDEARVRERVLGELVTMGIIAPEHQIVHEKIFSSKKGFPIPTVSYKQNSERLYDEVKAEFSNVDVIGRGSGKVHFMHEVMVDLWETLAPA
tara:strand:+ start:2508 stop:3845 length:1338 start_codon:yes stop_codon:yes gene_type:complete